MEDCKSTIGLQPNQPLLCPPSLEGAQLLPTNTWVILSHNNSINPKQKIHIYFNSKERSFSRVRMFTGNVISSGRFFAVYIWTKPNVSHKLRASYQFLRTNRRTGDTKLTVATVNTGIVEMKGNRLEAGIYRITMSNPQEPTMPTPWFVLALPRMQECFQCALKACLRENAERPELLTREVAVKSRSC